MRTWRAGPNKVRLAAFLCAGSLLATSCSSEPLSPKQIEALDDFGPGLQELGKDLADAGDHLGDAMCRLGKGFARGEHRKAYARRCPARHRRGSRDR
jgi:hypothetical protein